VPSPELGGQAQRLPRVIASFCYALKLVPRTPGAAGRFPARPAKYGGWRPIVKGEDSVSISSGPVHRPWPTGIASQTGRWA